MASRLPRSLWALSLAAGLFCHNLRGEAQKIPVITIQGSIINPVSAEYITQAIDEAEQSKAPALVIELDTPGGLLSSTRVIVKKMMNANVPVIVYVAPSGSRAGSAGVFITLAAHVAAMAPSTNIGAAHPVEFGENPKREKESFREWFKGAPVPEDPMAEKIMNDTIAWVGTIAKARGRNVDWAVRAVRESLSSREDEAVRQGVVDFIAKDLSEVLAKAEGKKVRLGADQEITLHLAPYAVERKEMTLRQKVLDVLINPNIAYILMVLGFYGLLFEITHPGVWFPGVAGLVCLILAFYAFHTLPTNYAGFALIAIAIVLFIAEVKVASYGLLSLAGIVCMLLGSLFLVDSTAEFMQISLKLIVPIVLSTALIFFFLIGLAMKARRQKSVVGIEGLVGMVGDVSVALPEGKILVRGETWAATSEDKIKKGEKAKVVSVDGMTLKVKKI